MNYEEIMLRAISEAERYKYTAKPNPVVGAILTKDKEIISEGYHIEYGKNHAEINALINARLETIDEKISFKKLIKDFRCVAVADGFYEWKREKKVKIPHYFSRDDKKPIFFAGIYESDQFCLITEEASENIKEIHALKTGKLIRSSFITTLQDENTIKFISHIAEQVGLAFQIIDDVLETTNPKDLGKNSESDIRNNKLTYVTQFGLEKAVTDAELIIKKANLQLENKIKNDDALNKLTVILNYIIERKN